MIANRRAMLAGGAAAIAGAAAIRPIAAFADDASAAAAAPLPSAYRYSLGDMTVIAATDGVAERPLDASFVTNAEFADVQAALEAAFLPTDKLTIPFTPTLLQTGGDTVLFDAGFGDSGGPTTGKLRDNMAAAGIAPGDVTKLVISHFHPDHINGLKDQDGNIIFANAEVLVPAGEWEFWTNDANKAGKPEGLQNLFDLSTSKFEGIEVTQFKDGEELVTGVTAVDAPGHTPGHTAFALHSGDDRMLVISDTTVHPALFVANPDWSVMFDLDADMARETRHKILDMAASERMLLAGYHFPFPATGHVARDGDGYRLVPINWLP